MSFIINVFDNILKYKDEKVFIVLDIHNNIWLKMKDVFKILGYNNTSKAVQNTSVYNKYKLKYKYIKVRPTRGVPLKNIQPSAIFINESGLYQLLTNSTKPIANEFKDELFTNILPSIRETGTYKEASKKNSNLKELNERLINQIKKVEEENNYYEDKHAYKPTKNSYIYILKKNIGRKNCFKIGYTDNIEKRLKVYKTGSPMKLIYYIPIIFDGLQTEQCVKSINKLHKLKNKTDDLCFLSLNKLKESIKDCLKSLKLHICNCAFCKKKFKINNMDKHICD
jgi:prophage antirepressor-like protein